MSRLGFVGQRLLQMVPVAIGVTILVFFMIHLVPGDPARTMLGVHATDQAVAVLHHKWGLDRSLFAQYGLFMNRLFHGNFGDSLFYRVSARTLIFERLPATLWLIVYAAVLSVIISVPLATLAATHKNKWSRPRGPGGPPGRPGHAVVLARDHADPVPVAEGRPVPRRRVRRGVLGPPEVDVPARR